MKGSSWVVLLHFGSSFNKSDWFLVGNGGIGFWDYYRGLLQGP